MTRAEISAKRRDLLRSLNRCICGPAVGSVSKRARIRHGKPYKGGRCKRCWRVKLDRDDAAYWQQRASA